MANFSGSFVDDPNPMSGNIQTVPHVGIQGPRGPQGPEGGHYVPNVKQTGENELLFEFTPSDPDMPAVDPVKVSLAVAPGSGGNVDLIGYAKEQWVQANYQPKGEYLESSELTNAVNTALAQAKESGEFDGENGKTAYQYAQDGGYTGTEEDFALKLAEESVTPSELNIAVKNAAPRNLLDNSDFRNPVNQRGYVSGTAGAANYTIDRWKLQYDTYLHLHSGYVGLSGSWDMTQLVGCKMLAGKTYTFSLEAKSEADNENMFMRIGDPTGTDKREHRQTVNSNSWSKCVSTWTADRDYEPGECDFSFGIHTGNKLTTQIYYKNPAVYEGEYTIDTLPEYQPKGYAAELLECQRYLQRFRTADLRKAYCDDFRPTMRETAEGIVSTFDQEINGVTYYFASAEL